MSMSQWYCVIIVHAVGEFPKFLKTIEGLPLLFDSWAEAADHLKSQIGVENLKLSVQSDSRATTLANINGTRYTILRLKDVD